jgi:tRNA 2-thiouridine synthesizing protein C
MTHHFFLFSEPIVQERLSWIEEILKHYFMRLSPETLRHPLQQKTSIFSFFITGDALYSFTENETLPIWDIISSLPSIRILCDQEELDLRGISIEPLKMKYPGLIYTRNSYAEDQKISFWDDVIDSVHMQDPLISTIGYLQIKSPYMYRSGLNAIHCLSSALNQNLSIEYYAYLDGIHTGHLNQRPSEYKNLGESLINLGHQANTKKVHCTFLASSRSAIARGYGTWDDTKGAVISSCMIKPIKIRPLNEIVDRFYSPHVIFGENIASIGIHTEVAIMETKGGKDQGHPPIIILITNSPYDTGIPLGALTFASACAHRGISTKVLFIEDGVYAVSGVHKVNPNDQFYNIQDVIDSAAWNEKLQLFVFLPSLNKRGIVKNKKLNAVLEINSPEFAQMLFSISGGQSAEHQRILFF